MKRLVIGILIVSAMHMAAQVNLSVGLEACYALNNNCNDEINILNGILSAVTPAVDRHGTANSAYAFNGTAGSYIELPNTILLKAEAVSFSAWVKFNALNDVQFIVFTHNGCNSYHEGYQLALEKTPNPHFLLTKADASCSPGGQIMLHGTFTPAAQTWYHVGFYAGADSLKLYVNGQPDASLANANPLMYNPAGNVYLGGTNLAFNYPLSGSLDNVRFYDRKLNNAEMLELYSQNLACGNSTVSIPQNNKEAQLSVFPNPGIGLFEIQFPAIESGELTVTNALSQPIYKQQFKNEEKIKIDLSRQENGIYFLQVITPQKTISTRVIKK